MHTLHLIFIFYAFLNLKHAFLCFGTMTLTSCRKQVSLSCRLFHILDLSASFLVVSLNFFLCSSLFLLLSIGHLRHLLCPPAFCLYHMPCMIMSAPKRCHQDSLLFVPLYDVEHIVYTQKIFYMYYPLGSKI